MCTAMILPSQLRTPTPLPSTQPTPLPPIVMRIIFEMRIKKMASPSRHLLKGSPKQCAGVGRAFHSFGQETPSQRVKVRRKS